MLSAKVQASCPVGAEDPYYCDIHWEASHVHSIARSATTYLDRIAIWDLTHKKKIAHSISMTFGIRGESLCLCFEYYSPVLALASLGLERFCEKDSAILKKRALTFTLTLGILGKSLLSLKLLSCPGICGTGTKIDWPGKNERSPFKVTWHSGKVSSVFETTLLS